MNSDSRIAVFKPTTWGKGKTFKYCKNKLCFTVF